MRKVSNPPKRKSRDVRQLDLYGRRLLAEDVVVGIAYYGVVASGVEYIYSFVGWLNHT